MLIEGEEGQSQEQPEEQQPATTTEISETETSVETGEGEEQQQAQSESKKPDWKDRRIAQLTARLAEAKRQSAAPETSTGEQQPSTSIAGSQEELDRLVDQRADEKSVIREFNRQCTEVAEQGKAQYEDFQDRVNELVKIRDPQDLAEAARYNSMLSAIIETGKGPALIHQLGGDLDEATRIMNLPPVKQGIELARMADRLEDGESRPTNTPRPPRVPGGSGGNNSVAHTAIDPGDKDRADRLSTAEWMRRRQAQIDAREPRRAR